MATILAALLLAVAPAGAGTIAAPAPMLPAAAAVAVVPTAPLDAADFERLAAALDPASRMTLATTVNGRGPYPFTIDTAADRSVISDQLAAELGLPAAGAATLYGIVGPTPVGLVTIDRLGFGRREHRAIAAPVLPRQALGAQGFVGLDALAGETLLLDFARRRISIARSPAEALDRDPQVIVVTGRSRFGQLILTDARIGRTKVYAIVDTGAQNSIGNLALRRLLGRAGPLDSRGCRILGVTGAELPGEPGLVPRLQLGTMTVGGMPIVFADVDTFRRFGVDDRPAILIGMDLLRRFDRVAIDFRRRSVRFRIADPARGDSPAAPRLPAAPATRAATEPAPASGFESRS